jgi:Flp pilus assembly protein TadG
MKIALSPQSILARFRRDEKAVAAVEFALIVPFLITLYLGSIEAATLFTVDKRINSISATIGDLVGQWDPDDGKIKTTDLTNYMDATKGILAPYSTSGIKIIVTLVKVKAGTGVTTVMWSRANTGTTPMTEGNPYTDLVTTSEMNRLSRGGCVIAAEVTYSYRPLLGQVFKSNVTFKHTNYFLPRFGSNPPIEVENGPASMTNNPTACTA